MAQDRPFLFGQRAAMVIRLYYEELSEEARERSGTRTDLGADLHQGSSGRVREIIAKKAGMSARNVAYLIAVYRNRPDLFEEVFNGSISINKAYTKMKADEEVNGNGERIAGRW